MLDTSRRPWQMVSTGSLNVPSLLCPLTYPITYSSMAEGGEKEISFSVLKKRPEEKENKTTTNSGTKLFSIITGWAKVFNRIGVECKYVVIKKSEATPDSLPRAAYQTICQGGEMLVLCSHLFSNRRLVLTRS